MRGTPARRRALLLATLVLVTVSPLALASSAQAVGTLKAGVHGRANVVDPASSAPLAPEAGSDASGASMMAGGLAALALVLGGVGIVSRAGWSAGRRDAALARRPTVVSPVSDGVNGEEESEARREAA